MRAIGIFPPSFLPPLVEQNSIVQKVDELMLYCNELESSIKQSESQNEKITTTGFLRGAEACPGKCGERISLTMLPPEKSSP